MIPTLVFKAATGDDQDPQFENKSLLELSLWYVITVVNNGMLLHFVTRSLCD